MNKSSTAIVIIAILLLLLLVFTPLLTYPSSMRGLETEPDFLREAVNPEFLHRNIEAEREGNTERIVVSLTTIPERIHKITYTIKSILKQTRRVDEVALNLPLKTLKGKEYTIPDILYRLPRLKIYRIDKDFGPSTKLLPTLQREGENTRIIVVDDDVVYNPILVEKLVEVSDKFPNHAVTTFPKKLRYRGENQPPVVGRFWTSWVKPLRSMKENPSDIVMGVYGFLVKPRFFDEDVFNYEGKPEEVVWVDDIHISAQLDLNGTKIISPKFNTHLFPLPIIDQQRTLGLYNTKNHSGSNDNKAIEYYWNQGAFRKV